MTFSDLQLDERILEAISYMGFDKATPIQEMAIPNILSGRDLIACAQTGTGKTAAFMLPILHLLCNAEHKGTAVLVVVPTRELAMQIDQQIQGFAYFVPVSSIAIYGGGSGNEWEMQKKGLEGQTDIIIATPGKLLSHIHMGNVKFSTIKYLILDEADRMLDMGFFEDIKKIIETLPLKKQTLMFSATMPPKIRELAKKYLHQPQEITIQMSKPSDAVVQSSYLVNDHNKAALIKYLIDSNPLMESIIIFSSTKKGVIEVVRSLGNTKYAVEGVSSDLEQKDREDILNKFRAKLVRVIVATDVLARGIDIKGIDLVINYNVPGDAEDYVHRIGRTGRADAKGIAYTLVNELEMYKFSMIEKRLGVEIEKKDIPKEIGESPIWNPKSATDFKYKKPFKKKPSYNKNTGNPNKPIDKKPNK